MVIPKELGPAIQAYADAYGYTFEDACIWLLRKGTERALDSMPDQQEVLVVKEDQTLSEWDRFKGTRIPLQVLVDNLKSGMTLEEFIEEYGGMTLADIAVVQGWL